MLEAFGLQLAPLLEEVGLECDALQDPENRVAVDRIARLLMLCAEKSGRASFGLLLGQNVQPAALGAVAQLLLGAPSVERALRGLILNLHLNGEAVVPTLTVIEDTARLSLTPYAYHPNGSSQLEDMTLAVTTNILRFLCGPRWSADSVALAHREPTDRRAYDEFFKAPVQFGAELTVLRFPSAWLAKRPETDQAVLLRAPSDVGLATAFRTLDIATRARRAVVASMAQGNVGVDRVATFVGLSRRTLNRRLAEQGTSTRSLIVDVRIQIAQQLMQDTDLSLADIAATACYSDTTAFSRAFQSRVGMSPAAWRSRLASSRS